MAMTRSSRKSTLLLVVVVCLVFAVFFGLGRTSPVVDQGSTRGTAAPPPSNRRAARTDRPVHLVEADARKVLKDERNSRERSHPLIEAMGMVGSSNDRRILRDVLYLRRATKTGKERSDTDYFAVVEKFVVWDGGYDPSMLGEAKRQSADLSIEELQRQAQLGAEAAKRRLLYPHEVTVVDANKFMRLRNRTDQFAAAVAENGDAEKLSVAIKDVRLAIILPVSLCLGQSWLGFTDYVIPLFATVRSVVGEETFQALIRQQQNQQLGQQKSLLGRLVFFLRAPSEAVAKGNAKSGAAQQCPLAKSFPFGAQRFPWYHPFFEMATSSPSPSTVSRGFGPITFIGESADSRSSFVGKVPVQPRNVTEWFTHVSLEGMNYDCGGRPDGRMGFPFSDGGKAARGFTQFPFTEGSIAVEDVAKCRRLYRAIRAMYLATLGAPLVLEAKAAELNDVGLTENSAAAAAGSSGDGESALRSSRKRTKAEQLKPSSINGVVQESEMPCPKALFLLNEVSSFEPFIDGDVDPPPIVQQEDTIISAMRKELPQCAEVFVIRYPRRSVESSPTTGGGVSFDTQAPKDDILSLVLHKNITIVVVARGSTAAAPVVALLRPMTAVLTLSPAHFSVEISTKQGNIPWWPLYSLRTDLVATMAVCRAMPLDDSQGERTQACLRKGPYYCSMACDVEGAASALRRLYKRQKEAVEILTSKLRQQHRLGTPELEFSERDKMPITEAISEQLLEVPQTQLVDTGGGTSTLFFAHTNHFA